MDTRLAHESKRGVWTLAFTPISAADVRGLVARPRLVLADEPTGALDEDTGRSVLALLRAAADDNGAGLVIVTHDLEVAAAMDSVYRLGPGGLEKIQIGAGRHLRVLMLRVAWQGVVGFHCGLL